MADTSANEVAKNSDGGTTEVLPDDPTPSKTAQPSPKDPPRTEATDTRAPESKDADKAPKDPIQQAPAAAKTTTTTSTTKSASHKPAPKPAAKSTSKSESKTEEEKPKAKPATRTHKEWSYEAPDPSMTTRIQRSMGRHGWYTKPADGKFEEHSRQGVQRAIQTVGYEGAINGQIGEEQAKLIQKFAKKHGTYTGAVNGKVDDKTWAGFAVALERLP